MSSGWNTVETPMCLNGFRSIIRIGSTLSHLHSDAAFSCYLYFHSAWRWLLSYSKILHCLLHSENYWYVHFHSVWWWLLSCRKILHCLIHSDAFYWYVYFHSVWWWLVSYRKIIHHLLHSDTFYGYVCFHSVWWWLMSYRKILHCRLHSDAFYCHLYFHSAWWWLVSYIQTPSTAICTSTKPDGDYCPTLRHLLLLFVLPLSLMVIVVLHSDTFYCYLYFH